MSAPLVNHASALPGARHVVGGAGRAAGSAGGSSGADADAVDAMKPQRHRRRQRAPSLHLSGEETVEGSSAEDWVLFTVGLTSSWLAGWIADRVNTWLHIPLPHARERPCPDLTTKLIEAAVACAEPFVHEEFFDQISRAQLWGRRLIECFDGCRWVSAFDCVYSGVVIDGDD